MAATISYAKHYVGSRPTLVPSQLRRVGGGYAVADLAIDEVEGLYSLVERLRGEKETAEQASSAAVAAAERARMSHQSLADEVARGRQEAEELSRQLEVANGALAERSLQYDSASQRVGALEAQLRVAEAAQHAAHRAEASGRERAGTAERRAVERDQQLEVLMQALRERTSELERLKEREAAAGTLVESLRERHRKEFEEMSHRAGELERELRHTLSSEERRFDADRATLRNELDEARRRADESEKTAGALEREVERLGRELREESTLASGEADALRQDVSETREQLSAARRQVVGLEADLGRTRRQLDESGRQHEMERERQVGVLSRELERARSEARSVRHEAERAARDSTDVQARLSEMEEALRRSADDRRRLDEQMREAVDERRRLEEEMRRSEEERRRLGLLSAELPAEARRKDDALREVSRLREAGAAMERRLDETSRAYEQQLDELRRAVSAAEQHSAVLEREADVSRAAAVAAIEEERRLRASDAEAAAREARELERATSSQLEALRRELEALRRELEEERSRRREAARAAIEMEAKQQAAVAEESQHRRCTQTQPSASASASPSPRAAPGTLAQEHHRRLQLENAARLERTARRDLHEERKLMRALLKQKGDADGASTGECSPHDEEAAFEPSAPLPTPVLPSTNHARPSPTESRPLDDVLGLPTSSGAHPSSRRVDALRSSTESRAHAERTSASVELHVALPSTSAFESAVTSEAPAHDELAAFLARAEANADADHSELLPPRAVLRSVVDLDTQPLSEPLADSTITEPITVPIAEPITEMASESLREGSNRAATQTLSGLLSSEPLPRHSVGAEPSESGACSPEEADDALALRSAQSASTLYGFARSVAQPHPGSAVARATGAPSALRLRPDP